jgi:predicted TIM-barrel fold metal-dependent hydrolase
MAARWRRARRPNGVVQEVRRRARRRLSIFGPRLLTYEPRPCLVAERHEVTRARVPAVDAHTHVGRWLSPRRRWVEPDVDDLLARMAACGVVGLVNLDGRWGDELERNLDRYDRAHPGRCATFCHVDWREVGRDGFTDRLVRSLERSAATGAKGLKVWKDLGLHVRDARNRLILPDDERLVDLWQAAGMLGLPVLIHVGDPAAFFRPVDRYNERLEELWLNPSWAVHRTGGPSLPRLLDAFETAVASSPGTTWIGAHAVCPEDLDRVSTMLGDHPNLHIDTSARLAELGRQPRRTRRFLIDHADRILFGTDLVPFSPEQCAVHFRFFETDDEYFPYWVGDTPPNGRWHISGVALPDDVLHKLYRDNAARLVPGLAPA